jgi:hypothetical protein
VHQITFCFFFCSAVAVGPCSRLLIRHCCHASA